MPKNTNTMTKKTKKPRTYNRAHQITRKKLLHNHQNGTPCWWCGRPMHKNPQHNWDHRPLHADHSKPIAQHGTHHNLADRLLHATCNEQRGDGTRDHTRPAAHPTHTFTW